MIGKSMIQHTYITQFYPLDYNNGCKTITKDDLKTQAGVRLMIKNGIETFLIACVRRFLFGLKTPQKK